MLGKTHGVRAPTGLAKVMESAVGRTVPRSRAAGLPPLGARGAGGGGVFYALPPAFSLPPHDAATSRAAGSTGRGSLFGVPQTECTPTKPRMNGEGAPLEFLRPRTAGKASPPHRPGSAE